MVARRLMLACAAGLALLLLAAGWVGRQVEARVAGRLRALPGLDVQAVRFSWLGPLRLEGLSFPPAGANGPRVAVAEAGVHWRLRGGREPRAHVHVVELRGVSVEQGGFRAHWPAGALDVLAWTRTGDAEHLRVRQRAGAGQAEVSWERGPETWRAALGLDGFDLSTARVTWNGESAALPGRWTGQASAAKTLSGFLAAGRLQGEAVRIALPRSLGLGDGRHGEATSLHAEWDLARTGQAVELRHVRAQAEGLVLETRGRLDLGHAGAPVVDLELSARSDLGPAFRATGLALPASLSSARAGRVGTASLHALLRGPLGDLSALRIVPRLEFECAPEGIAALQFLRRPFRFAPEGEGTGVEVGPAAPDFLPLADLPPLFERALLVSEDAGFYGHPGIDVAEIPVALAVNVERGSMARGASTITQQLVKNLFLSAEKTYGRKLSEAALALVLDAAVPKARLLEIYVNVIEWGPGFRGIVPAARHYFGKRPSELTAKETAFLVCLIPSPVRYHRAHAAGRAGPGLEQLTHNLLAKLRAVDALSEEEYQAALAEDLSFQPESGPSLRSS